MVEHRSVDSSDRSNDARRLPTLLEARPTAPDEAMAWLGDVWRYLLDGGMYFSGGPGDAISAPRLRLKDRMLAVAANVGDRAVSAEAYRISAHVLNASERYDEALPLYSRAIEELEALGLGHTAARTKLGYASVLQLRSQHRQALAVCRDADRWFVENGDDVGHARALTNTGNVHHRVDEHAKALECHLEAARVMERVGGSNDLAIVSLNIANSYAFLDRFVESDDMYRRAETIAADGGLTSLADQARYNRAYLFFLRGHYSAAIAAFTDLRNRFESTASWRHVGLCDLDQSEVYLQLNLYTDAVRLAERARQTFSRLAMRYEEAKAIAFLGVADTAQHRYEEALTRFEEAEPAFASEGNAFWTAMTRLFRAETLFALGMYTEARVLGDDAMRSFVALDMPYQKGLSLIVLGKVAAETAEFGDLRNIAGSLLQVMAENNVPLLEFPAHMLCAEFAEKRGDLQEARQHYVRAAKWIEVHRSFLRHDELRVRFLEGKQAVYESLVRLDLDFSGDGGESAFAWCERAKARALTDLLSLHLPVVRANANPRLIDHVHRVREQLVSRYVRSRADAGELAERVPTARIEQSERELERGIRELSEADADFGSLFGVTAGSVQHIQQVLPEDTTLVEYFVARGEVLAFLIEKSAFRICRRLASIEHIRELRHALDFQMQKFVLGEDYEANHRDQTLHNTRQYLERLYADLVATWVGRVHTSKLLFVPHDELHGLPFHALFDGERYLCDRFTIFYAPSAEVFRLGCAKPPPTPGSGLLIGHADELAPSIEKEIERLSAGMPECDVLTGSDATRDSLFRKAPGARFVHISSHGLFREDDPMFSGFRLSDGLVTALDLYSQSWPSELVSLTGCSTGAVRVIGGDELMGLVRGFLYAGARSLLLSLWNVNDEATVDLMVNFYAEWRRHGDKARAIQSAMQAVRAAYSHPFYWAPFVLIGQP